MLINRGAAQTPTIYENGIYNSLSADVRAAGNSGLWREVIENHGSSALVAFHAGFHCAHGALFYDHDPLFFYGMDVELPPRGSFEIDAADPSLCHGGIDAAIFADGHTEGDPVEIAAIFRRRGIYEAIRPALTLLQDIAANRQTSVEAQAAFSDLEDSTEKNHRLSVPERLAMRSLFQRLRLTLKTDRGVVLAPSDGKVRGLSYDEIAATQKITMEQAQAMVIAKKLEEWRGNLEGFLSPVPVR